MKNGWKCCFHILQPQSQHQNKSESAKDPAYKFFHDHSHILFLEVETASTMFVSPIVVAISIALQPFESAISAFAP